VTVTSTDVARLAGVSQATVSRVLADSERVSEATRLRVLNAMAALGYSPNLVARAMKTRRTGSIGVVVSQLRNPFYPEALEAIGTALARADQRMVLFSTDPSEDAALDAIRQGLVDGVLFTSGTTESKALREAVARHSPVLMFNRSVPDLSGDQVTNDNPSGASAVAEHLVAAGHRRIGFLGGIEGPGGASTVAERHAGFAATLERLGHPLDPGLSLAGPLSYESGDAGIGTLLARSDPPTAVFCVNDITALGALDGARRRGFAVPARLSIVGYDDIEQAAWDAFRLTTIRQPLVEMAARSVELLLERIADPERPARHERFPAELVLRGSTGHPSGAT
jgi:LacI family transcriptional regulator